MFVIVNHNTKVAMKIWRHDKSKINGSRLEQAYNLSNLPFLHKYVALMPDTHTGMGMPIGGVIATDGVIIPNVVGVEIRCGMGFIGTGIKVSDIKDIVTGNGSLFQAILGGILMSDLITIKTVKYSIYVEIHGYAVFL